MIGNNNCFNGSGNIKISLNFIKIRKNQFYPYLFYRNIVVFTATTRAFKQT